jgi:nucleotide-binding universal stress UspA family protein
MYPVLIAVDRSETRAEHQAAFVADLPHAETEVEATVLYVFPHADHKGAPKHEFEEVDAAVTAADHLESAGISVNRVAEGGEVVSKILAHAADIDARSIVLGGRKRSGVAKVIMGSTAMDVLVSAERPVVITG